MIAGNILSQRLFPLRPKDSIAFAREVMSEYEVAYLPVVEEKHHLGYISSADLLDAEPTDAPIDGLLDKAEQAIVIYDTHLFEIIKIFSKINSTVVSVLDEKENFIGIITAKELVKSIASLNGFSEEGSILTLEMGIQDYSLSEIARLIEYNDAKILSSYVHVDNTKGKLYLSLKLNTKEIKSIVGTFQRYDYKVVASYFNESDISGLKNRYDQLMKYLDL